VKNIGALRSDFKWNGRAESTVPRFWAIYDGPAVTTLDFAVATTGISGVLKGGLRSIEMQVVRRKEERMFARVRLTSGLPERVDDGIRHFRETVVEP
jgi:hypothetical protein